MTFGVLAKIKKKTVIIFECEKNLNFLWHTVPAAQIKTLHLMICRMKRECTWLIQTKTNSLIIGDDKMIFEPISPKDTTLNHYGKRDISWHGFCLQFYLKDNVTHEDGTECEEQMKYTAYINQIVNDGNQQDCLSVFALIDSAMNQISEELPFITNIILQTDNTKSYNNTFQLCAIQLFNVIYKCKNLSIIEFIHTKTQDGKTILDVFFATCMKFI